MLRGAAFLFCACAAGVTPPDAGPLSADTCQYTGGKTGTEMCTLTEATWTASNNQTAVQISTAPGATSAISVHFTLGSTPSVTTFSGGVDNTQCAITLQSANGNWSADTLQSVGACSLVIQKLIPLGADATQRRYELHGSFSASLQPDDGVSALVSLMGAY